MNDTGIEKKKKGKPVMKRWRLFRGIAGIVVIGILVIVILAILGPIINGQIRETSLSDEHIPLATSLLDTPLSVVVESENVLLELDVEYSVDSWGSYYVCVYTSPETLMENYSDSRLFVNGIWVIGASTQYYGARMLRLPAIKPWCGWGELESGIHLIEFELRDSMFGEPVYTQQWAIEVE